MAEDQDQKTEDPTGKRLDEARDRGQLPVSRELSSWFTFVAILLVVSWLGPKMSEQLLSSLRIFLEMPQDMAIDDRGLQTIFLNVVVKVGAATWPVFVLLAAAGVVGTMIQTGFFASLDLIRPDVTKLSPMNGLSRLFSANALADLLKNFGKLFVLGLVVFLVLWPLVGDLPAFTGRPLLDSMSYLHQQAIHLIIILLLVFTIIALADLFYQRWHYIKGLRMTKAEVKDEFRQQEGDPMIKSRLRQIRLEKARKRMMAQVPKADVVVTNPTHYAIAMKYDSAKMGAPLVLAKGIDNVAQRIREVAEEHRIPLVSNPPLARALYDTVEIDQQIPTQHYRAVAEVISYVYKLRKRKF